MAQISRERHFLEVIAGNRCPCGHLVRRHRKHDPDFKVGDLVEVYGACWDCDCQGEVRSPEMPESEL